MSEDVCEAPAPKGVAAKRMELYRRIGECDWTPDAAYQVKGRSVRYVSGPKLKRTIRPLLCDLGLVFDMTCEGTEALPPCGAKENHHRMTYRMTLTDAESGERSETVVTVEGADAGDKAMLAGAAYAKRCYWINNFDIVDGMEDEDPVSSSDVAANLLRRAVPETPAQPPAAQGRPAVTSPGQGNLSATMVRAMDNALAAIRKADEEGRIMHEYLDRAVEIRSKAAAKEDVQAILSIKAELGL